MGRGSGRDVTGGKYRLGGRALIGILPVRKSVSAGRTCDLTVSVCVLS